MKATIRTFVGIRVTEQSMKSQLKATSDVLQSNLFGIVPFMPESDYHMTLRFLGDIHPERVNKLLDIDQLQEYPRFQLTLRGMWAFPKLVTPHVVWAGVYGDVAVLNAVQAEVDRLVVAAGFPSAEFEFQPHITIGRLDLRDVSDDNLSKARSVVLDVKRGFVPQPGSWTVRAVEILESVKGPYGVEYHTVAAVHLNGGY